MPARTVIWLTIMMLLAGCQGQPAAPLQSGEALPGALAVAVGYLNEDPYLDLVLGTPKGATILRGTGAGFEHLGTLQCPQCDVRDAAIGDLNEDGREDLLLLGRQQMRAYLHVGDGYVPQAPVPIEPAVALALIDVDNDGWLDITIHHEDGTITLRRNVADRISEPVEIARNATTFAFFLHDEDLFLDLAVATPSGLAVHRNSATNETGAWSGFTHLATLDGGARATTLAVLDADNDQRMDVAAAGPNGIHVLLNTGRSLKPSLVSDLADATWIAAIDLDNDGLEDLVAGAKNIHILNNRGDGKWHFQTGPRALQRAAIGDWDRDGRVDLASFSDTSGQTLWNRVEAGHYLSIRLRGNQSNESGLGIKATLTSGHSLLLRQSGGLGSAAVSRAPEVHFGLGEELAGSYALAILWPSGILQFDEVENPEEIIDRHTIARESPKDAPWDGC